MIFIIVSVLKMLQKVTNSAFVIQVIIMIMLHNHVNAGVKYLTTWLTFSKKLVHVGYALHFANVIKKVVIIVNK